MPISISPTIASININAHDYNHIDWENNTPGTLSGLANDIASQIASLELVGILTKAIGDGTTYLTGPESTNIGFVFTGALTAQATVVFATGSQGIAQIENQTTGGFSLVCSLPAGSILVPPLGSAAALLSTGLGVTLQSGIVRTSAGTSVTGGLVVAGTVSITGAVTGSSQILSGNMTVGGNNVIAGSQSIGNNETVAGAQTVSGAMSGGSTFNLVGAATIGGAVSVGGAATVVGALDVTGASNFTDVTISGANFNQINGTGETRNHISAAAGEPAWHVYETAGESRWLVGKNATAETGSDDGSDYIIGAYSDLGVPIISPVRIKRSNGNIILALPTSSAGLASGTLWNDAGVVKIV